MEDCGGEGYTEEEAESAGDETYGSDTQQDPYNKEWWPGKEYPPTQIYLFIYLLTHTRIQP